MYNYRSLHSGHGSCFLYRLSLVYLIRSNLVEENARAGVRTQGVPHERQACCQVHYTSTMYNYRSLHLGHGSCLLCILAHLSTVVWGPPEGVLVCAPLASSPCSCLVGGIGIGPEKLSASWGELVVGPLGVGYPPCRLCSGPTIGRCIHNASHMSAALLLEAALSAPLLWHPLSLPETLRGRCTGQPE